MAVDHRRDQSPTDVLVDFRGDARPYLIRVSRADLDDFCQEQGWGPLAPSDQNFLVEKNLGTLSAIILAKLDGAIQDIDSRTGSPTSVIRLTRDDLASALTTYQLPPSLIPAGPLDDGAGYSPDSHQLDPAYADHEPVDYAERGYVEEGYTDLPPPPTPGRNGQVAEPPADMTAAMTAAYSQRTHTAAQTQLQVLEERNQPADEILLHYIYGGQTILVSIPRAAFLVIEPGAGPRDQEDIIRRNLNAAPSFPTMLWPLSLALLERELLVHRRRSRPPRSR
jgi:hypothetical protein